MKYNNITGILIFLIVSTGFQLSLSAQQVLQTSVFGSGGAVTDNPNLRLDCTLGQLGVGMSDNANFTLNSGFWYSADIITVVEDGEAGIPEKYELYQNYPNPFNPATTIKYAVPEAARIRIELYNLLGQQVRVLLDEEKERGYHTIELRANGLASGIYLYRMIANNYIETKKLILLK